MRVGSAMARCVGHISSLNVHSEVVDIGFSVPICKRGKNLLDSSLLFWSGKRDSHLRCARAFPRILTDIPGPWKGRFEVACAEFLMHRHTKEKGESLKILPFALDWETDFRSKHIPCPQSAYYVKHFPQRSLPLCGHHALVCIPMLLAKIQKLHLIQAKMGMVLFFECGG